MEATEEKGGGLLHHIIPPRLEDAGLEDCALQPDSIKEAFLMAATAVKSRAASILTSDEDEDSDGDCVRDPWPPAAKDRSDDVEIGGLPDAESPGAYIAEKGGGDLDLGGDKVVDGGGDEKGNDEVVDGSVEVENGGKACVEGLAGLEIDQKKGKKKNGGDDEDDEDGEGEKERPILVGGYV